MKRNDVMWTRRSYIESGAISDQQLVPKPKKSDKADKADGLLSIKRDKRLDPAKYGGYNSLKGAHFALIECSNKRGEKERRIVQIPMIAKDNIEKYTKGKYGETAQVVLPVIKYKALIKIDKIKLHIANKDSDTNNGYQHAIQAKFKPEVCSYAKRIYKVAEKDRMAKQKYDVDAERDKVNCEQNLWLFDEFCKKLEIYSAIPEFGNAIGKILLSRDKFADANIKDQCLILKQMFFCFSCSAQNAKLGTIGCGDNIGRVRVGNDKLFKYKTLQLINQSPTGLYEEVIDLKTVQPKIQKASQ